MVKHLPKMWEAGVRSLCQEDPLEREMAIHSSTLAWKIHRLRSVKATVHGIAKSQTRLGDFTFSRLVIAFLPRNKCLVSFNFMAAVTICSDFGAQNIKCDTVSTVSPFICHEVMGPDAMILAF